MTNPMDDNANDNKGENAEEMSFAELFESYDMKISNELNQGIRSRVRLSPLVVTVYILIQGPRATV